MRIVQTSPAIQSTARFGTEPMLTYDRQIGKLRKSYFQDIRDSTFVNLIYRLRSEIL